MKTTHAEILQEYGPFPEVDKVHGVTFDGENVWIATGQKLHAVDPLSGEVTRSLTVPAEAGTAFDGVHFFQIAGDRIQKVDPKTGRVIKAIAVPGGDHPTGLAWAEGLLWMGQGEEKKILCIDPETGAVLRTLASDRFVTGVTWVDGELWHGTWEESSDVRRIDAHTGEVREVLALPDGIGVSGLESDGKERFYCGECGKGRFRAIRRPRRDR